MLLSVTISRQHKYSEPTPSDISRCSALAMAVTRHCGGRNSLGRGAGLLFQPKGPIHLSTYLCGPPWRQHKALHPVRPSARLSLCLSVTCLRFTWNEKAVETLNLVETWVTWSWTWTTGEHIWGQKVKVTGNENVKIVLHYVRLSVLLSRVGMP